MYPWRLAGTGESASFRALFDTAVGRVGAMTVLSIDLTWLHAEAEAEESVKYRMRTRGIISVHTLSSQSNDHHRIFQLPEVTKIFREPVNRLHYLDISTATAEGLCQIHNKEKHSRL